MMSSHSLKYHRQASVVGKGVVGLPSHEIEVVWLSGPMMLEKVDLNRASPLNTAQIPTLVPTRHIAAVDMRHFCRCEAIGTIIGCAAVPRPINYSLFHGQAVYT